jgi:cytochrome oxidase Cu insertion factor (SCO1/SenC/PrrC family)
MSDSTEAPVRRHLLWGVLVAVILAVVVTALMAPRWTREMQGEPPLELGRVPDFSLVNRDGRQVGLSDLEGSPWVAKFIFTRCGISCPRMTAIMVRLGEALPEETRVHRVSVSVDPEHDTPEVLQAYAESFGVEDDRWLFLTGEREAIYPLMIEGFKLGVDASPPPEMASAEEPILHSTRLVLVDGRGEIRGYYDGFHSQDFERLLRDLAMVSAGG